MARKRKYRAKRTTIDGITFHSKLESEWYAKYKIMEKAGEIFALTLQPEYEIIINDQKICKVILDFTYLDKYGREHVIDVKGYDNAMSRLKRKLVKACHNVDVEIVK